MRDSTRKELAKTLGMIAEKVGGKTIILFANHDGVNSSSGGVITGQTDYASACKMNLEMTTFISDAFGDREHDEIDT